MDTLTKEEMGNEGKSKNKLTMVKRKISKSPHSMSPNKTETKISTSNRNFQKD